jgi:hypothetical protein
VVCVYSSVLLSHYKERNNIICSEIDGIGDHPVRWNKPVPQGQISHVSSICKC